MPKEAENANKIVARNKKARFRYEILETWEAGLVLTGPEVKSLRAGRVSLAESFARFRNDELYLMNCHISPYEQSPTAIQEPTRPRKLLLRRREIRKLKPRVEERGLTLIPLSIYFTRGLAKAEIGLARGKQLHDKRESMKRKDAEREMRRSRRR